MVFSAVIIDRYIYRMIDEGYKAMRDGRICTIEEVREKIIERE